MEQTLEPGVSEEIYAALQRIVGEKRPAPLTPTVPEPSAHWTNLRPLEARLSEMAADPSVDMSDVPIQGRARIFKKLILKATYWLFHPLFRRISHFHALLAQFSRFSLDELRQLAIDVDNLNKHLQRWETLRGRMDISLREIERAKLGPTTETVAKLERLTMKVMELEQRLNLRDSTSPHFGALRAAQAEAGGEIVEVTTKNPELAESLKRAGCLVRAMEPASLAAVADETVGGIAIVTEVESMRGDQIWLLVQTALRKLRPNGLIVFESPDFDRGAIRPHAIGSLLEASGFREVQVAPVTDGRIAVRGKR